MNIVETDHIYTCKKTGSSQYENFFEIYNTTTEDH